MWRYRWWGIEEFSAWVWVSWAPIDFVAVGVVCGEFCFPVGAGFDEDTGADAVLGQGTPSVGGSWLTDAGDFLEVFAHDVAVGEVGIREEDSSIEPDSVLG